MSDKRVGVVGAAGLVLLGAPWLALVVLPARDGGYGAVAGMYLLAGALAMWLKLGTNSWPGSTKALSFATCLLTVVGATFASALAGPEYLTLVGVAGSFLAYYLAWHEQRLSLIYCGSGLVYLALSQVVPVTGYDSWAYGAALTLPAIMMFGLGYKLEREQPDYGSVLRYSGLVGPLLAALVTLVAGGAGETPMICLAVGGALLLLEAFIENSLFMAILAGGLILAAYNWLLIFSHIFEAQIYAVPWTIFFAYLTRRLSGSPNARLVFMALALATLTLPIMAEATSDNGIYYGAEAIFLGMALSVIGSVTVSPLVMWWGGGVALIEILYWVPKYFWPGSEIPLICASMGLAALAIAVMARYKAEDSEEESDS